MEHFTLEKPKDADNFPYKCPKCGSEISTDFKLCPYCGEKLPLVCSNCWKVLSEDFKLCPYCGAKTKSATIVGISSMTKLQEKTTERKEGKGLSRTFWVLVVMDIIVLYLSWLPRLFAISLVIQLVFEVSFLVLSPLVIYKYMKDRGIWNGGKRGLAITWTILAPWLSVFLSPRTWGYLYNNTIDAVFTPLAASSFVIFLPIVLLEAWSRRPWRITIPRRRARLAIIPIIIVLVAFFAYVAYAANNEKTAMDNLSYTITSASLGSITPDMVNRDVTGSVVVSMRFYNPTGYDTPTFSVDFDWYISSTTSLSDAQNCGTGKLASAKIMAGNHRDSTFTLSFSLNGISLRSIQCDTIATGLHNS